MKRRIAILLLAILVSASCAAQEQTPQSFKIKLAAAASDGIFDNGRLMQVYAIIHNKTDAKVKDEVTWQIHTDQQMPLKQTSLPVELDKDKNNYVYCPVFEPREAGFYHFKCTLKSKVCKETFSDSMTVGLSPLDINPPVTRQPDFDKFWQKTLQELKDIDPQYNLTLQTEKCTDKRDLYLVEMKSLGNLTVRGWLEVPKNKGKYPALLRVPGYTSAMEPVNKYDDMVIFSFNVRGHGNSDDAPGAPLELWVRGLDDKNDYYYRGTFMDCIRAMDFLSRHPSVDPKRIAVWGGSQGGGLAFVVASLDKRVNFCIADVPFLCDMKQYFKTTQWQEVDDWLAADPKRNWNEMLRTMSYFDTMNMTDKITCPVLMGIGLQDIVCPPSTSFASYNKIKSQKEYIVYPRSGHDLGKKHSDFGYKQLRKYFGL